MHRRPLTQAKALFSLALTAVLQTHAENSRGSNAAPRRLFDIQSTLIRKIQGDVSI